VVDYEERYEQLEKSKIVISATRSPHCTLSYDKLSEMKCTDDKILFDLAVPRDIDPQIAELKNFSLYDIDDLGARMVDESENEGVAEVKEIIREEIAEFERWNLVRGIMPKINEISDFVLSDLNDRLVSSFKGSEIDEGSRKIISQAAEDAVSKVIVKFILSLQKDMDSEMFEKSFLSLSESESDAPKSCENTDSPPPRFPLYVDLSGREVAVIGAGNIAMRRIKSLLNFPCRLKVVAPEALDDIKSWAKENKLVLELKAYESRDIENSALVIAATDSREVNAAVAADARKTAKPCSIADNRDECTFYFPSIIEYDGGVIGVCGTGENHGRTKEIAADIREFIKVREEFE
jgi:siroheme synthase-like protein